MRTLILRFTLVAFLLPGVFVWQTEAQQAEAADLAPIPMEIAGAKKVFIANAGGDCSPFGKKEFTGGPNVAYNQFFSAMKKWGHFTLVATPADADLVMEIHFTCPFYFQVDRGTIDAQLRLVFLDPKTRILLWTITEHFQPANRQENRDKEFGIVMGNLISDMKALVLLASVQPDPNK